MKSNLPSCQRHNLQHRGHPAMPQALRASSLGNIDAGNKVGIMLETTKDAPKAIAIAVRPSYHSTPGASLAGKFRGYFNHWYPFLKSFISGEILEFPKSPRVKKIPLFLSNPSLETNKAEVFKGNRLAKSYGFLDNEPTYVMQHPDSEPFLPPTNGNKSSFSRAGASLLKLTSFTHKMLSFVSQRKATEEHPSRKASKMIKPTVNADSIVNFPGSHFPSDGEVKIEGFSPLNNLAFSKFPADKVLCLVVPSNYRNSNPTSNTHYRKSIWIKTIASPVKMKGITIKFLCFLMPPPFSDYFTNKARAKWRLASKIAVKLFSSTLKRQIEKSLIFVKGLKENIVKIWGELKNYCFGYKHGLILT